MITPDESQYSGDFFSDADINIPQRIAAESFIEKSVIAKLAPLELRDKARKIYLEIANLPIGDLHTHYDVTQIKQNIAWESPTQAFLGRPPKMLRDGEANYGFDHYVAQLMLEAGVNPEIVYGKVTEPQHDPLIFEKERFTAMFHALCNAPGSEVTTWFQIALEEVFDISITLKPENAEACWDQCFARIQSDDFRPQAMLDRHKVLFALTTDDPTSDLSEHSISGGPKLIPTWRADSVLMLIDSGRYNFSSWIRSLSNATGISINDLDSLKSALENRLSYFLENGCIAADLGIPNFESVECTDSQAEGILRKKLRASGQITSEEMTQWQSYMLEWLLTKNAESGLRQYIHQGPRRDQNLALFNEYGADIGGDGPGEKMNRKAFVDLLQKLSAKTVPDSLDGTALAPTVFFPLSTDDFSFVLNNIRPFQANNAGIAGKLQLGPPWWFGDTQEGNGAVINEHITRGSIKYFVGMLSDARSLPVVIARMKQFRAILAVKLANAFPDLSEQEIVNDIAADVCYNNGARFLGLPTE